MNILTTIDTLEEILKDDFINLHETKAIQTTLRVLKEMDGKD